MTNVFEWVMMFTSILILDWVWAKYNQASVSNQPLKAAVLSIIIFLLGAVGVMGYTTNKWLLIPACFGAFIGTYIATRKKT